MIHFKEENLTKQMERSGENRPGFLNLYGSENYDHDDGLPGSATFIENTYKSLCQLERQCLELGFVPYLKAEVEFATYKETIGPNAEHWKAIQAVIIADLETRGERKLLAKVREFGPREVMMYDIMHRDERTRAIVETLQPEEYFDAGDMMELQLRHDPSRLEALEGDIDGTTDIGFSPVQEYIDDLNILGKVIHEKCNEYGLILVTTGPAPHVNVSFWDQNGNVLDHTHPDYGTKGKQIAQGMLKGTFDSFPIYLGNNNLIKNLEGQHCNLDIGRESSVRNAQGRLETRPTSDGRSKDSADPFLWAARDIAGALYGLRRHNPDLEKRLMDTEHVAPIQDVNKLAAHNNGDRAYKVMTFQGLIRVQRTYWKHDMTEWLKAPF